jgi:hypothetical protein
MTPFFSLEVGEEEEPMVLASSAAADVEETTMCRSSSEFERIRSNWRLISFITLFIISVSFNWKKIHK